MSEVKEIRRVKLQTSVSPDEYDRIYRVCRIVGLKPGAFIRQAAMELENKMRAEWLERVDE